MPLFYFYIEICLANGIKRKKAREFNSRFDFLETLANWNQKYLIKSNPDAPKWMYVESYDQPRAIAVPGEEFNKHRMKFSEYLDYGIIE